MGVKQKTTARPNSEKVEAKSFYLTGALTACVYLAGCLLYVRGYEVYTRAEREVFAWLLVLPLLYLFWRGYRQLRRAPNAVSTKAIVCFAALFCLAAFFTYPFHSTDVFGYVNRGWQQVRYGQNPYVYTLAEVPGWQQDPMLREHWIYNPNPYGFLFTLLARAVCRVAYGNWYLSLQLFKALNVAAYAGIARLVWLGAKRLKHARPDVALYLILWNPLLLLHHVANGHNDLLTGFAITLGLYLALAGAWFWVVPVLVAATLLKYAPALLIPLALVLVVKNRGWKVAALSCVVGGLVAAAVSAPYLVDLPLLLRRFADIRDNATLIDNSLHSFLIHIFENAARLLPALAPLHSAADTAIKTALRVGFLIFLVPQGYKVWKERTTEVFIEKSVLILFVLFCVVTSKFNGWYMGMLLPPALLLPERHWLRRVIVLITAAQVLSLTFFKQAYILNYFAMILLPAWLAYRQGKRQKAEGSDE
jgi:hypothetical protein